MQWLGIVLALVPIQAKALSCVPWGVTDAYLQADSAPASYIVVFGDLTFNPALLPQVDPERQGETPPLTQIPASFAGQAVVARGADVSFSANITLEVQCFGPWCAQPVPGKVLAFVRQDGDGYVVQDNPCGGHLFMDPRRDQIRQVRQCMRGQACLPLGTRP